MTSQGVRHPTTLHFTIDGRPGTLEARDIAAALRIPYEPLDGSHFGVWTPLSDANMVRILSRGTSSATHIIRRDLPLGMLFVDHVLRANLYPLQHIVQRRGPILEALFRISEGYWFSPSELLMSALFYFEDRVHRKKLQRAATTPLLFPRILCVVLEHLGFPTESHLERRHHCREVFTVEKWRFVAGCSVPSGGTSISASTEHQYVPPRRLVSESDPDGPDSPSHE